MGNTSCCCSCSPFQPENQNLISSMPVQVDDMSHIHELLSYIDQLLNAIGKEEKVDKPDRVDSFIKSGGDLLEKVLKRANRHTCKMAFMPRIDRETRKLVVDMTKEGAQIKWLGVALSVVAFVLERIGQVSSNINECKELLKYMCKLAKYIMQLDKHLPHETLNEVLQFIVKGSLMCVSQMKFSRLSRLFDAAVEAEDLLKFQSDLGTKYPDLTLQAILDRLPPSPGESPEAVGIEEARDDVIELLDMTNKSLKVVVIYGQGGIGKTTLATAVVTSLDLTNYKYCRTEIEQNCSEGDLNLLQHQILKDISGKKIVSRSWVQRRQELSTAFILASKPVFMFIDNALKASDLEKLLPIRELRSLPQHSRILITTRNLNETQIILQADIQRYSYQVCSLPQAEAGKLLSKYALGRHEATFHPTIDIEGLLQICRGIPLVLKMAGSKLHEFAKSVPACKEAVEYLKEELLQAGDTELSERMVDFVYNRLHESSKEAFQDVVFFFYNWKRRTVAYTVGEMQLRELEKAALVNITDEGRLNVHDIVKARGRMLSDGYYRITDEQSLTDVLQDEQKIQKTKGIYISDTSKFELESKHLNLMSRSLRVLQLRESNIVNGECKGTFENVRFLGLNYRNYLQMDLSKLPNLSVFSGYFTRGDNFGKFSGDVSSLKEMYLSDATLVTLPTTPWQLKSLSSLTLRSCEGFGSLAETIGSLSPLENLNISSCDSLVSLPESFGNLFVLKKIKLSRCDELVGLPSSICNLSALEKMNLSYCHNLTNLPNNFGNLSALKNLILIHNSSLKGFPESFCNLSALENIDLKFCSELVSLPDNFGNLYALKKLDLSFCSRFVSLAENFGNLRVLESLNLDHCCSLARLPDSIVNLFALKIMNLNTCLSLHSLPDRFGNLSALKILDLQKCSSLGSLPDSFGKLFDLKELKLSNCSSLASLPDSFGNLCALKTMNLNECFSLQSLPDRFGSLSALQNLNLFGCSNLVNLPDNFGNLSSLEDLNLRNCSSLVRLPDRFGNLSALINLSLNNCSSLASLPDRFVNLSALMYLDLNSCSSLVSLPDNFGNLSDLEDLDLKNCSRLVNLPYNFGNLFGLKRLRLTSCSNLMDLPEIGQLHSLCYLDLYGCKQLSVLPESFGKLFSLNMVNMRHCEKLSYLPQNFGRLKSLKYVNIHGCKGLHNLSANFECLSSLIAIIASNCSQLEEKAMDTLAEMKKLMFVDINDSPMLIKRWEEVKEQYSLGVFLSTSQEHTSSDIMLTTMEDIMCRVFFHNESRFLLVDDEGNASYSSLPADGVKLGLLFTGCDLLSPSNGTRLERVKEKCGELVSQGFHIIYVDMQEGLWEETETRVRQTLPHLPPATCAWIAPDNKARLLSGYSMYFLYRGFPVHSDLYKVNTFVASTLAFVDTDGRRKLKDFRVIFSVNKYDIEDGDGFRRIFTPLEEAFQFICGFEPLS